jgi:hypothetical protein
VNENQQEINRLNGEMWRGQMQHNAQMEKKHANTYESITLQHEINAGLLKADWWMLLGSSGTLLSVVCLSVTVWALARRVRKAEAAVAYLLADPDRTGVTE